MESHNETFWEHLWIFTFEVSNFLRGSERERERFWALGWARTPSQSCPSFGLIGSQSLKLSGHLRRWSATQLCLFYCIVLKKKPIFWCTTSRTDNISWKYVAKLHLPLTHQRQDRLFGKARNKHVFILKKRRFQGLFTLQRWLKSWLWLTTTIFFIHTCLVQILVGVVDGGVSLLNCNLSWV